MLKTLTVWNFALIEQAQIDFGEGLNILTGETGAGKSILIDALSVALGCRASADSIRSGGDWLRVEAVYDHVRDSVRSFLADRGIIENEDILIVSRQIARGGKNQIRVNGCHVTLQLLKELGQLLVDIHGQQENQALLRSDSQFRLLDQYDARISPALSEYRLRYERRRTLLKKLQEKETDSREYVRRVDMLKWQIKEIAAARLKPGEDEALGAEIKILSNAEKISGLVNRSYAILEDGDQRREAVFSSLSEIKKNLETASRYDDKISGALELLDGALCQLQECGYELRDYSARAQFDPNRLNQLQERMDEIYKLRKKYGATIEDVLKYDQEARAELAEIENYDQTIADLKKEIAELERELFDYAGTLSELRKEAARSLSFEIQKHLQALGMANAKLQIEATPLKQMNANGMDEVSMLFSANLGEAPKPIQKVASGGELSRIALAIKAVCAEKDEAGVMVFDEIDAGIGGKTAQMVASRIAMVAAHKQVLCITHLPQIACMADTHLYIDKKVRAGKTATLIKRLDDQEQINELARMASGMDLTPASLDNAREMLGNAERLKNKWKKQA